MEVRINGVKYVPIPDAPTGKTLLDALEIRFDSDAGDNITVRDYLHELLAAVWIRNEGFSGKRPFGNSGWMIELLTPLAKNGFVDLGKLNQDGEPYYWSIEQEQKACSYVVDLIKAVFYGIDENISNQ